MRIADHNLKECIKILDLEMERLLKVAIEKCVVNMREDINMSHSVFFSDKAKKGLSGLYETYELLGKINTLFTPIKEEEARLSKEKDELEKINRKVFLFRKIEDIESMLSVRTWRGINNILNNKYENTNRKLLIMDLVKLTESEIIATPNFGRKSLNEIKEVLYSKHLRFGLTPEHICHYLEQDINE